MSRSQSSIRFLHKYCMRAFCAATNLAIGLVAAGRIPAHQALLTAFPQACREKPVLALEPCQTMPPWSLLSYSQTRSTINQEEPVGVRYLRFVFKE
jgi:hypothetical protein